jgi:hypothetical protein
MASRTGQKCAVFCGGAHVFTAGSAFTFLVMMLYFWQLMFSEKPVLGICDKNIILFTKQG